MKSKKSTGSYYTPKILSDFLVQHIRSKYLIEKTKLAILEPSCGDGQFISSLSNNVVYGDFKKVIIDIVDINEEELIKAYDLLKSSNVVVNKILGDYLNYSLNSKEKYDLIIGNPPYVSTKNMEENQIFKCAEVHEKAKEYSSVINSSGKVKNIWPAFVEASVMALSETGILCFVLPAEILQVKYTKELREFLSAEFERVEVFAFNELIFEDIEQDVIALIGVKKIKNKLETGVSFYQVESLEDLKEPKFTEKFSNIHRKSLDKWTNYILTDEELNFVDGLKAMYKPIADYCEKAEVGIVTAANDYFIISKEDVVKYQLEAVENLVKPILPKGTALPNTIKFTSNDYLNLFEDNKRVNLVSFEDKPKAILSDIENRYIKFGEELKDEKGNFIHKRYKMTKRNHWYHVPSIWQADGLFVKRSDIYPKVFVNEAKINATDSFYRIKIKYGYSIKKFVFSFYNSLTFCLAELEGRFYGGGVLELIPSEFKALKLPYNEAITDEEFNIIENMFRQNISIDRILDYSDKILLSNLNNEEIQRLKGIRKKLLNRRLKRTVTE